MKLDQFILFGDSLTQRAGVDTDGYRFATQLENELNKKYKVIVHGYPGANTNQAVEYIKDVIPSPDKETVRLLTIWYGTNDAGVASHVPIDKYKENLISIINSTQVRDHLPNIHIILITPPPIEETVLAEYMKKTFGYEGAPNMNAKSAAQYAKLVLDLPNELKRIVSKEKADKIKIPANDQNKQSIITDQKTSPETLKVVALDVWGEFISMAGGTNGGLPGSISLGKNQVLSELLVDGVHLTSVGYQKVCSILMDLLKANWPELV